MPCCPSLRGSVPVLSSAWPCLALPRTVAFRKDKSVGVERAGPGGWAGDLQAAGSARSEPGARRGAARGQASLRGREFVGQVKS